MKRVLGRSAATVLTAGVAVALAVSGAQAAATPGWRVVATFPGAEYMQSVSASDAANAWAVGIFGTCCDLSVGHWNGKRWETIATPAGIGGAPSHGVVGASVAAIADGRAMVFVSSMDEETDQTWVDAFEWRGRSWSAVHAFADQPGGVIASGPDDVWGFDSGTPSAEHYNGTSWSQVSIPVIVAQASGNAAAGDWVTGTVAALPRRVELLHWSKGAWRNAVLPKISVPKGDQMLPGLIAAATTADIWATVAVGPSSGHGPVTSVLLHWNGKAWSKVLVPNQGSLAGLYGLASDGRGGAWVVWNTSDKRGLPAGVLIYHYSAGHWTRVPAPAKLGHGAQFTTNLELIPGTRSVLAGSWGSILKYGP